jgi:hypothetical protein
MLRRAGRGTFHLPNSEGSTGQRGPVTMPMAGMEEPATATQEVQCESPPLIRLSKNARHAMAPAILW